MLSSLLPVFFITMTLIYNLNSE